MRRLGLIPLAGLFPLLILWTPFVRAAAQSEPIAVEPAELDRRADLVGRVITVDDRVKFYQFHPGRGYDELRLERTDVVFRLPPRLRPESSPRPTPVIVQGRLTREDGGLVCEVSSLKALPSDLERLDQAVAALPASDFENRKAWAAWAERRGKSFKREDKPLIQRARSIQADALRIEAEQKRGVVDAPSKWLELAEEGRRKGVEEPSPSALAHKALRAKLSAATRVEEIKSVLSAIERFFPQASSDKDAGQVPLGRWEQAYANDPAGTYRSVPANLRKPLDRRLWADALERLVRQQAAEAPQSAVALARRAEAELPERSELSSTLLDQGLSAAQRNLGSLRLDEVKSIGQAYRDELHNPQGSLDLYRKWLKIQRDRLSATDAEGPVALAALYEELVQDRAAARELLERAWKIDPGSKEVAESFRTRGYRRVKDEWVEATPGAAADAAGIAVAGEAAKPAAPAQLGLRGKSIDEVKRQLGGDPERKSFSGTKGQLIEQWLYLEPTKVHYVNFLHTPGEIQPRVVSDYFLPRTLVRGELRSAR
jgi:tetratricopeptide (TPR) repeat protein